MNIVILHGIGGYAGIHWQKWLNEQLSDSGYKVIMPNLPDTDHPDRKVWLLAVKKACLGLDLSKTIVIGHSLGATTALDYIEERTAPIKAFISVSGMARPYGAELNEYFLATRTIDFNSVRKNIKTSVVIYGDNDPYVTQKALKDLALELKVQPVIISGGGHINSDAGFSTFPQLLEIVKNLK